jgi:hypothetical protein
MSWKIEIHRAKPNPAGKDKAGSFPIASQLLGEWVDLKNIGDAAVNLVSLNLAHREFDGNCVVKTASQIYWTGKSGVSLSPGQIVRIHTGRSQDAALMSAPDQQGVHHHAFADKGSFVLNNRCGDTLSVWWKHGDNWNQDDTASYRPNPSEGKVLQRLGDGLT